MPYRFLEHTADVRLEVKGKDLKGLFSDAVAGMMAFLRPRVGREVTGVKRLISLNSPDATALLVDFLGEVLRLSQTNKEAYHKAVFHKLSLTSLEAELFGVPVEAFRDDIKAVTYHEAKIAKNEKGELQTLIVFDI